MSKASGRLRGWGGAASFVMAFVVGSIALGSGARAQSGAVTVTVTVTVTATATVDVSKVQSTTRSAIQGFMSQRANMITTSGPDSARAHARLGSGTLFGNNDGEPMTGAAPGFSGSDQGVGRPRLGMGASAIGGMPGYDDLRIGSPGSAFGGGSPLTSPRQLGGLSSYGLGDSVPGSVGATDRLGMLSALMGGGRAPMTNGASGGSSAMPLGWTREYEAEVATSRHGPSAFRFNGTHDNGIGRFAFATSLSQIRDAAEAQEQAKLSSIGAMGLTGGSATHRPANRPGSLDVWIEGTSSYFVNDRIDGKRQGHAALVHAGIDTVVMPGLLVGVMGSWDWMADNSNGGLQRDGRGWMAGPYVSARLTRNIYFDARATWGQSTNHVDPLGAYTDTYSTSRALASAKLTGDWSHGAFRFRPSAEVVWFTEMAKGYTNVIGIAIAEQTYSVGRAMIGPEVGYRMQLSDKSVVEPFVGLKGVWDFARTPETTALGAPVGEDGLRGRVEAGIGYQVPSGITVRAAGAYDGIGSDGYRAIQGQARLIIPLQ